MKHWKVYVSPVQIDAYYAFPWNECVLLFISQPYIIFFIWLINIDNLILLKNVADKTKRQQSHARLPLGHDAAVDQVLIDNLVNKVHWLFSETAALAKKVLTIENILAGLKYENAIQKPALMEHDDEHALESRSNRLSLFCNNLKANMRRRKLLKLSRRRKPQSKKMQKKVSR